MKYVRLRDCYVRGINCIYPDGEKSAITNKNVWEAKEGDAFCTGYMNDGGLACGITWAPVEEGDITTKGDVFFFKGHAISFTDIMENFEQARKDALAFTPIFAETLSFNDVKAHLIGEQKLDPKGEQRLVKYFREHYQNDMRETVIEAICNMPQRPDEAEVKKIVGKAKPKAKARM